MAAQTSSTEETVTFELLGQHIEAVASGKRTNKLSKGAVEKLKENLKIIRKSQTPISNVVIMRLVSLLDVQEHCCSRLETSVFVSILETLLQAEYSQQKERGVYLLAESIHYDCHKRPQSRTVEARRASIGKSCIHKLINCFTNVTGNARVRRWIGAMTLQLLNSDTTRLSFEAGPEDNKRKLGSMVVEEGNEILRIICGQILRVLLTWDVALKDLWPVNADPKLYAEFPLSSQKDKHWSNAFQAYIDRLFNSPESPPGDTGRLYFVQAVSTNPHEIRFSGCTISVFINSEISICTQPHSESFMECLDIPLDLIKNVEVVNTVFETDCDKGSQKEREEIVNAVDLLFTLTRSGESTCYSNAAPVGIREIRLTTSNENWADNIGSDVLYETEKLAKKKEIKVSQSKEIIVVNQTSENCLQLDPSIIDNNLIITGNLGSELEATGILGMTGIGLEQVYDGHPRTTMVLPLPIKDSIGDEKAQYVNPMDIQFSINKITEANYETLAPSQMLDSVMSQYSKHDTTVEYAQQTREDARKSVDSTINVLQKDSLQKTRQKFGLNLEEAELPGYGANEVLQPPPSTPIYTGSFRDPEVMKFSEVSNNSSASLTTYSPVKRPLMKTKNQKAVKPSNKPSNVISKIATQRHKKPGLIPKKRPRKLNTISSRGPSKPTTNSNTERAEIQLSKNKMLEGSIPAQQICLLPLPSILEKKVAKGNKTAEETAPEPKVAKKEQKSSKDVHEMNSNVPAVTSTERFSANLAISLEELDDIDQPNTVKRQESPQITPRQNQVNSFTADIERLISSGHQDTRSEEERAPLLSQTPTRKGKARLENVPQPFQRSPSLMSSIKAATVALNGVLVNRSVLVDDKMARKTPIVSFGAKGPLNQGLGGAEMSSTTRNIEAKNTTSCSVVFEKQEVLRTSKRKRVVEELIEMEETKQQQLLKAQIVSISHSKRALPLAFQHEQESVFANASPAEQNFVAVGSKRSRVDERGSPQASSPNYQQQMSFRAVAKKLVRDLPIYDRNEVNEGKRLNHGVDDCGLPPLQGTSLPVLLSIPLDPPLEPNDRSTSSPVAVENVTRYKGRKKPLQEDFVQQLMFAELNEKQALPILVDETAARYIQHKRASDRESSNLQREVHVRQPVLADPFLEKRSKRNFTDFTRRLEQSSEERLKYKSTVRPFQVEPLQKRAGIFDDPEVTLVDIGNQPAPKGVSSPSDMTDDVSDEYQDLEQQKSALSFDLTIDDEWRMALKPHQRGVLDALYQISNDLVRYLIGYEEAITDVINDYLRSGSRLITELDLEHKAARIRTHQDLEITKVRLRNALTDSRKRVLNSTLDITIPSLGDIEKVWKADNDIIERMVEEARRVYH